MRRARRAPYRRRGRDRARGEEDREEPEEDVRPQPASEAERDGTGSPATDQRLPPRDRVGGTLQTRGCFAKTIDDAFETKELALALRRSLIDPPFLRGHVREDRLRIGTRYIERA